MLNSNLECMSLNLLISNADGCDGWHSNIQQRTPVRSLEMLWRLRFQGPRHNFDRAALVLERGRLHSLWHGCRPNLGIVTGNRSKTTFVDSRAQCLSGRSGAPAERILKQRSLLDETLVICGRYIGRTPPSNFEPGAQSREPTASARITTTHGSFDGVGRRRRQRRSTSTEAGRRVRFPGRRGPRSSVPRPACTTLYLLGFDH